MAEPEGSASLVDRFNLLIERSQPVFLVKERTWQFLILASTAIVIVISFLALSAGVTTVFMHLYYIPIILLAYHYRRTGFFLAVLLTLVYLGISAFFEGSDPELLAGAGVRSIIFIGVAALVVLLSEQFSRSRDELREVADLMQSSMMNAQVWLTVLDPKGTILLWNKAAERISGYPAAEVVGKNDIWKKIYPDPDYRKAMTANITRIIGEKDFLANLEATILCRDGERKTISWNTRMLPARDGEPKFVAIGVEITEQKRAEAIYEDYIRFLEELEKVEEIIRRTTDPERMIMDVLDRSRDILESDRAWLLYPADPEAPSFRAPMIRSREEWALELSPDTEIPVTPEVGDAFRAALRTEGPVTFDPSTGRSVPLGAEFSIRSQIIMALRPRRGKAWIFGLHQCSHPHTWTEREQRLFTEIGRRLSDGLSSMLLLQELRESEKKYRTVFETTGTAMVVLEDDATISLANEEFLKLSGYSREELGGKKHWTEFVVPEDLERMRAQHSLRREGPGKALKQYEFRFLGKNGEIRDILLAVDMIPGTKRSVASLLDVTERKREEMALRKAYNNIRELEFIVRHSPAVAFLWRAEAGWPVEFVSANIGNFGYSPDDFLSGRIQFSTIIHPDDAARVSREVLEYSSQPGRAQFSQEYRILTSSGDVRWIDDWTWIRRDDQGTITHYQGIILDGTSRKKAEAALRESEEKYRDLVENINDVLISLDAEGVVTYISPVVKQATGYSPEEIIGHPYSDFVYPEDLPKINEGFGQTLSGNSTPVEFRLIRPDGTLVWLRTRSRILTGFGGKPQGLYGIISDISEQKKAEEARRLTEERYHNVLDTMMEGCQILDFDWRYQYVNDAVARQGRRTKEELIGQRMMDVYPGIEFTDWFTALQRCMEERVPSRIINKFAYPGDGSGWFDFSIQPVSEGIFILSIDITETKQAEEKVASAVAQIARNLEQMAVLNDYIRNPLSVIVGLADMEGGKTNEKILRAAREIDHIITELDRGWIESDKVRRFLQAHHHLYPQEEGEGEQDKENP